MVLNDIEYLMLQSNKRMTRFVDQSIQKIMEEIYQTDFAQDNVDLNIQEMGQLNYTIGKKLRMTFVDTFQDTDIEEWRSIAIKNGATDTCVRVNTSTGNIDLNIEYKGRGTMLNKKWILQFLSLATAAWSWYQLHLTTPAKYPLPIW